MKKLPNCPRCQEDELWRVPGKEIRIRCYECGYDSGVLEPIRDHVVILEVDEDALIQAHVTGAAMAYRSLEKFKL
jgi:hypothetical protein